MSLCKLIIWTISYVLVFFRNIHLLIDRLFITLDASNMRLPQITAGKLSQVVSTKDFLQ